jgi:predicted TIM-barrel fold metal-dependent hydrolase
VQCSCSDAAEPETRGAQTAINAKTTEVVGVHAGGFFVGWIRPLQLSKLLALISPLYWRSAMIIDVHCHVGLSARTVRTLAHRFSFERNGAEGCPGYDSYLSPRLMGRFAWRFIKRWLGVGAAAEPGDSLDNAIEAMHERHFALTRVDRLVLLAFDEYRDDQARVIGSAAAGQRLGSDVYVSNSFVKDLCTARPDCFMFGASIHPYRPGATEMLEEVAAAGAVLLKWLPIHQNIRAEDPRTVAFLRKAAELRIAMLIHYGGEMSLARQHMEFESPVPMLGVLRKLRSEGCMPTVIVAHAATPSFIWQSRAGHDALVDALIGEFSDAPLYADISALSAMGRSPWLRRLAARRDVHRKLLWGSDFPIPVMLRSLSLRLPRAERLRIAGIGSWIEQSYETARWAGYDECVFTRAANVLRVGN